MLIKWKAAVKIIDVRNKTITYLRFTSRADALLEVGRRGILEKELNGLKYSTDEFSENTFRMFDEKGNAVFHMKVYDTDRFGRIK